MDFYKKVILVIVLALMSAADAFVFDNAKCKFCYFKCNPLQRTNKQTVFEME